MITGMSNINKHVDELMQEYRARGYNAARTLARRIIIKNGFNERDATLLAEKFYIATKQTDEPRKQNPTSKTVALQRIDAEKLYRGFTGHEPDDVQMVDKPEYPAVMSVIGDIDGILYTTVRDGKEEKYIHKFKKNARPLFCVAPDGKTIHLLGGAYVFGNRGIVDN